MTSTKASILASKPPETKESVCAAVEPDVILYRLKKRMAKPEKMFRLRQRRKGDKEVR